MFCSNILILPSSYTALRVNQRIWSTEIC